MCGVTSGLSSEPHASCSTPLSLLTSTFLASLLRRAKSGVCVYATPNQPYRPAFLAEFSPQNDPTETVPAEPEELAGNFEQKQPAIG